MIARVTVPCRDTFMRSDHSDSRIVIDGLYPIVHPPYCSPGQIWEERRFKVLFVFWSRIDSTVLNFGVFRICLLVCRPKFFQELDLDRVFLMILFLFLLGPTVSVALCIASLYLVAIIIHLISSPIVVWCRSRKQSTHTRLSFIRSTLHGCGSVVSLYVSVYKQHIA